MITARRSQDRGKADHGWLKSWHSFSFANYYDPAFMGFRSLRVINEDIIQPGGGFDTHGHRDMEIITYIIDGALQHRDSLGMGSIIRPGDIQRMSAGTGIMHSEFNASQTDIVHLLQIWILPEKRGLTPSYEEKNFASVLEANRLCRVVSPDGSDGTIKVHQDMTLYAAKFDEGQSISHQIAAGRGVWIQTISGQLALNDMRLNAGDAAAIDDESSVTLRALSKSEFLLFDLV